MKRPKIWKGSIWDIEVYPDIIIEFTTVVFKPLIESSGRKSPIPFPELRENPSWCWKAGEVIRKTEYSNFTKYWPTAFPKENVNIGHCIGMLKLLNKLIGELDAEKEFGEYLEKKDLNLIQRTIDSLKKAAKNIIIGLYGIVLENNIGSASIEEGIVEVVKSKPRDRPGKNGIKNSTIATCLIMNWRLIDCLESTSEAFDWCKNLLKMKDRKDEVHGASDDDVLCDRKQFIDLCSKIGLTLAKRGAPVRRV